MDYEQARALLRRHKPVPWFWWLLVFLPGVRRIATCQACGQTWRCWSATTAIHYIEQVDAQTRSDSW